MKKLLLVLFLLPTIVFGRKFYVSESGSDAYTTTQAQNTATPWKTLSKAQSKVANGDSVLFAKGDKFSGTLTLQSKSNVYFGVYGTGADPLFWGTGNTLSVLITLNTCTNITFYGWTISDTTISATDRYVQAKIQNVFATYQGCTGIVIRKCRMDRIGYGAYFPPDNNNNTVDSCDIGNLRMIKNTPRSVNADDDYGGVPVQLSSSNNTVTNNYFHDCYAASYDYTFDGGGIEFFEEGSVIENNIIAYNTFYDCNGIFEFGSSNDGVANNKIQNNKIYYNKIINNNTVVYINNNGQYRTKVVNLQLYNNVMLQTVPNTNPSGSSGIMFSLATSDATAGIIVLKNNIIQVSNGLELTRSGQLNGTNLIHTNNIYKLSNGSVTNFTLDATEISTSGTIWTNTSNTNPLNWDYRLTSTSPAINSGVNVGLTRDFVNNVVNNPPDIGILEYGSAVPPVACTFTYGSWTNCINGSQTRTFTGSPVGCLGTPPLDSIQKSCTSPACTFTYGSWSVCTNNIQTRSYSSSPVGCVGTPIADNLVRPCTLTCTFTYSAWSICLDSFQSRTFTKTPIDCTTNPSSDSILRKCNSTPNTCGINYSVSKSRSSCLGKANGSITVTGVTCGTAPYTLTLTRLSNSATISRTTNDTTFTFSNLFSGGYTLEIRDFRGNKVIKSVNVGTKSNRTYCR